MSLTFHEGCVGAAVVVKVSAVRVVQTVVSQAVCVAETLQDTVHETLRGKKQCKNCLKLFSLSRKETLHKLVSGL